MSNQYKEFMEIPTAGLDITSNGTYNVVTKASVDVLCSTPIEVSTDSEMLSLLTSANEGKCYKFTGTTGTYTNGDLYIVEEN